MNSNIALKSALLTLLASTAMGLGASAHAGSMASDKPMAMAADNATEKCYGVNAAHKNDCKAGSHSCAGQSAHARDPKSFVEVPSGLCSKIDGGSAQPKG